MHGRVVNVKKSVEPRPRLPGLMGVVQPVGQVAFLLAWGLLMGTGAYLDGPELGRGIHTACGAGTIAVTGVFTFVCGLIPLVSATARNRWFRPGVPWQGARFGLWVIMLIGLGMIVFGSSSALNKPF